MAHTDVGADLQRACHIDVAITTTAPVVVFHLTTVHAPNTTACVNDVAGVNFLSVDVQFVIKCHKE